MAEAVVGARPGLLMIGSSDCGIIWELVEDLELPDLMNRMGAKIPHTTTIGPRNAGANTPKAISKKTGRIVTPKITINKRTLIYNYNYSKLLYNCQVY
jgi:hypothetical protein